MKRFSHLFLLLLLEVGKLQKITLLVFCYDEDRMHEAIERASHEKVTEATMLMSVSHYISQHKFFAHDPRNGQVCNICMWQGGIKLTAPYT